MPAGVVVAQMTAAGFIQEQWSSRILSNADARAVFPDTVLTVDFPPGSKLHLPKLATPTVQSITRGTDEGDALTFATVSDNDVEMLPLTAYAGYQLPYTTLTDLGSRLGLTEDTMSARMSTAIVNKWDTSIAALQSGLPNEVNAAADALVLDDILEAIEYLEVNDAPRDEFGLYYGVFHPYNFRDLMRISEVTTAGAGPDLGERSPLRTGVNLRPYGLRIFFSTNTVIATNSKNMVFAREAFGLARITEIDLHEQDHVKDGSVYLAMVNSFSVAELEETWATRVLGAGS
jgi:hypothetical protein